MEQQPLDYGAEESRDSRSDEELAAEYKKKIGVDPRFRSIDRRAMLSGIEDPEAERERIANIDREEDKNELKRPYQRS